MTIIRSLLSLIAYVRILPTPPPPLYASVCIFMTPPLPPTAYVLKERPLMTLVPLQGENLTEFGMDHKFQISNLRVVHSLHLISRSLE